MCGIPRSGSTLVWQILCAVFPDQEILKTHPDCFIGKGAIIVSTIRDPYDVVASAVRVRLSRGQKKEIEDIDVEIVLEKTGFDFDLLKEILKGPSTPVLRYENFYNNYDFIYRMIEIYFDIKIPGIVKKFITEKFSLKNNQIRADALENFNQVDEYHIHGDHIGYVIPGYWNYYFCEKHIQSIKTFCDPLRKEWGY